MPAHRTLSDTPRRSRRLSQQKPKVYDSDGYECLLEQEDDCNPSQYPSESTVSSSDGQGLPVFTMPFSMTSTTPEAPTRATKSHSRRRVDHIRRPPNAFILFRSECCKNKGNETDEREISRLAGRFWRELPEVEKEVYRQRAQQVAADHSKLYPGYKYTPSHRNKPKVTRRNPIRDTVTEIRNCSDLASRIMRGQPLAVALPERTPTPALSAPASDPISIKLEEEESHPGHLASSSTIKERDITPTGPSSVTTVDEDEAYSFVYPEYRDFTPHPEGEVFECQEFIPTELIPPLDLNATYPQTEAHAVEVKVEEPQPPSKQSPPLPFHTDIDVAFGFKPTICNLQLAPGQVLFTNSSGYLEVSSYASDASFGWGSPREMTSWSSSLNEGLHYDYSGSTLYTPSCCEPSSSASQSPLKEVDAMLNQLSTTTYPVQ